MSNVLRCADDWHGLTVSGTDMGTMHVGPLPGRKSIALYHVSGGHLTVLAYFPNEAKAAAALAWLDRFSAFIGWAGSTTTGAGGAA